jgi:hypothetical protein
MHEFQDIWPLLPFGDFDDVAALVMVLAVLALRVLPSTRKWAPRGNAPRPARPRERTIADPGNPLEPGLRSPDARPTAPSQQPSNDGRVLATR